MWPWTKSWGPAGRAAWLLLPFGWLFIFFFMPNHSKCLYLMYIQNTIFSHVSFCSGMSKLRFKPAYNPYTEPSMEIFGYNFIISLEQLLRVYQCNICNLFIWCCSYHEGLKKWVEVGNSGMFRPEMLLPMGLPEDVTVIAWGLSLERYVQQNMCL